MQGDMELLDREIQLLLAVLKEWETDMEAGNSSVYLILSSADETTATASAT